MEEQEEEQTEITSQPIKKSSIIQQIQDIEAMKSPSYQSGQKPGADQEPTQSTEEEEENLSSLLTQMDRFCAQQETQRTNL